MHRDTRKLLANDERIDLRSHLVLHWHTDQQQGLNHCKGRQHFALLKSCLCGIIDGSD